MPEGIEELEPLRPPDGAGILGELRPEPPELLCCPPLRPEEPEEPPGGEEVGEGIDEEEDCCWQPPINSAEIALTVVACIATTNSRFHRG